ncbi:hypothetical protein ACJMK2_009689 [Sinanodonta woodiana]|uniref:Uncharacterized protein n=1 Tax=Sinanodonta woodiana TaxID=1069815 RepID=A0ABD3VD05_SINWO
MDFPRYSISGQSGRTYMDNMPYNGHFESYVPADPVCSQVQQAPPYANPLPGQYASSPVWNPYPPSGASDILQQGMNVTMMNYQPSNPCDNYSICSPATHSEYPVHSEVQQFPQRCADPFVGQFASSSVMRTCSPANNASDLLLQATDHSMNTRMTSQPSNPYGNNSLFSPATTTSTEHSSGYLNNLRMNPMFQDLQMLLNEECYGVQVPSNLITTSWNLMQLPLIDSSPGVISGSQDVFLRHMQLQNKLMKVRTNPYVSADGLKVDNEYSTNVGQIEMRRYQDLVSNMGNTVMQSTVNSHYDKERLMLVQKVEADLEKLIVKVDEIQTSVAYANVMQKESKRRRPLIRKVVKTEKKVQQPTFGGLDDADKKDSCDYGLKSDGVDVKANLDTDKVKDIPRNDHQIEFRSEGKGKKRKHSEVGKDDLSSF